MNSIQSDVEGRLAGAVPEVEVLLVEVVGGSTLRVFIDHPQGVTLELCERVSRELGPLRERYALEVSSPGRERPLSKPQHFRRHIGSRARIRTRAPLGEAAHKSFTGELVGAGEREVTIASGSGLVAIPYAEIVRSNLVGE